MSATNKENYRPVSVLPPVSTIFKRLFCNDLSLFIKINFHLYYEASGKILIVPSMHLFVSLKDSNIVLTSLESLQLHLWTSPRHMIVYLMIF